MRRRGCDHSRNGLIVPFVIALALVLIVVEWPQRGRRQLFPTTCWAFSPARTTAFAPPPSFRQIGAPSGESRTLWTTTTRTLPPKTRDEKQQPGSRLYVATVNGSGGRQGGSDISSATRPRRTTNRRQTSTTTTSARRRSGSGRTSRSTRKKTVQDRTQEETLSLIRDIIRAAVDIGPRAGPARTLQAYRAVTQTAREMLFESSSGGRRRLGRNDLPVILRTLFERMGATYVKLGQFIASSPTLFPAEYVVEFQKCLDQTEPLPWSVIRPAIEKELGGPIGKTFSYVDRTPLASASIAQVHAAKLRSTGEEVVIKVQKPGIDDSLKADLSFLYVAARVVEFFVPDWERTSLAAVTSDIRTSMMEELDFRKEAKNTIEFRRFLQEQGLLDQATAPRVYLEHTTSKIMTMERLNGVSLLDEKAIASITQNDPSVGTETIITALNIWSTSVTSMPWFHADVHAGNLLLLEDGRVGFIDFGIVGRISDKVFQAVNELSAALVLGDSEGMAVALCNMGAADESVDTVQFGKDIERVLAKMDRVQPDFTTMTSSSTASATASSLEDDSEITDLLLELVAVTEDNGLKLPREFGLLVKQSLYFDRYLKILAPNVDVMNDDRVNIGGQARQESSEQQQPQGGGETAVNGDREAVVIDV